MSLALKAGICTMRIAPLGFRPPKRGVNPQGDPCIHELRNGQCKYPTGFAEGEHRFCAAPAERQGASYCAKHHTLCHGASR